MARSHDGGGRCAPADTFAHSAQLAPLQERAMPATAENHGASGTQRISIGGSAFTSSSMAFI